MSSPTPDHRSIASEWQTTSLLVPKESRESDGAGLRWHTATPSQTPSPRLIDFVPERQTAVKKNLIFFPSGSTFFTPAPQIVGLNLADDSKMLIWRRLDLPQPAVPAAVSRLPH